MSWRIISTADIGADEAGDRAHGQVDVAGDDDDDHADGQDQDVAVLLNDVGDVQRLQQDAAGPDLEQDDDHGQGDEDAVLAEVALQ